MLIPNTETKSISLTLNRWHKIVERLNVGISENLAILKKRVESTNFSLSTKAAYTQDLVTKYEEQALLALDTVAILQNDLINIKDQVARANMELGITHKLTQIAGFQRVLATYKIVSTSSEDKITYDTFTGLDPATFDTRTLMGRSAGMAISIVQECNIEIVQKAEFSLKVVIAKLSDDISDLNRNKVSVELSLKAIEIAAIEVV